MHFAVRLIFEVMVKNARVKQIEELPGVFDAFKV